MSCCIETNRHSFKCTNAFTFVFCREPSSHVFFPLSPSQYTTTTTTTTTTGSSSPTTTTTTTTTTLPRFFSPPSRQLSRVRGRCATDNNGGASTRPLPRPQKHSTARSGTSTTTTRPRGARQHAVHKLYTYRTSRERSLLYPMHIRVR